MDKKWTYKEAGVDVAAGERVVENIKKMVPITQQGHPVVSGIGGFSGIYGSPNGGYLLASCDGVGTKLLLAQMLNKHSTIGIDLVAMVVNDLLVQGGQPLFFLDYLAVAELDEQVIAELLEGIVAGCLEGGCALLGGETAEMPGVYPAGGYDLAGFGVAQAQEGDLLPREDIKQGDVIIGLPSSGLHSNGYSLARKVLLEVGALSLTDIPAPLERPLGEVLLEPTIIYTKAFNQLKADKVRLKALAHITGGGISGNIPRILPDFLTYSLDKASITVPPIFKLISNLGAIDEEEMLSTFNMGIGMVAILAADEVERALTALDKVDFPGAYDKAKVIGTLVKN